MARGTFWAWPKVPSHSIPAAMPQTVHRFGNLIAALLGYSMRISRCGFRCGLLVGLVRIACGERDVPDAGLLADVENFHVVLVVALLIAPQDHGLVLVDTGDEFEL